MLQSRISVLGATRISVGLSQIVKIQPAGFQSAISFKILSGGGTLEVVNAATLTGTGWGTGYPLGASEVMNVNGSAICYVAATGATMVLAALVGRTAGATVV